MKVGATRPGSRAFPARFGAKIDLEQFTTEQLQDVRNKLRTSLSQVETNEWIVKLLMVTAVYA